VYLTGSPGRPYALWASYLVKAYAWRTMLSPGGVLESALGGTPGYGFTAVVITLTYLWLPYMILPIYVVGWP
jgi:putative spermidine/putrescine transport system permease protein